MTALMYHDVAAAGDDDSSGFPGRDAGLYKITPELFGAHLDALQSLRSSALAITFDDGGSSALIAADLLQARGLIGHFFITTNYIGTRGFLTERGIRELARRGHVIGSHSCSHPLRMSRCGWPQLVDEWTRSCAVLSN